MTGLRARVAADVAERLRSLSEEGRAIAVTSGEDDRPPLTRAQRWRFSAQTTLRGVLTDEHPAMVAFDRHCYQGILQVGRFGRAVELFEAARVAALEHALACRFGTMRALLEPLITTPDIAAPEAGLGGLWHAAAILATVCGVREPGEHPSRVALGSRLVDGGLVDVDFADLLGSTSPEAWRQAALWLDAALDESHD